MKREESYNKYEQVDDGDTTYCSLAFVLCVKVDGLKIGPKDTDFDDDEYTTYLWSFLG